MEVAVAEKARLVVAGEAANRRAKELKDIDASMVATAPTEE